MKATDDKDFMSKTRGKFIEGGELEDKAWLGVQDL